MVDVIKGAPVRVLQYETRERLSDISVDMRGFNAANVAVYVTATTPQGTVSVEGCDESGGNYLPLPDPTASQVLTASAAFDVMVGMAFLKIRLASVTGTFGANRGFTVVVTPFISPGPVLLTINGTTDTNVAQYAGSAVGPANPIDVQGELAIKAGTAKVGSVDLDQYTPQDVETGAGTTNALPVALMLPGATPAVGGTAMNPVRTDPTGTTTQPVSAADGADVAQGTTTDAPADVVEDGTARTGISLWKGIKNYLKSIKELFIADDAPFIVATSPVLPVGALADETAPDSVDEGDIGILRMTLSRILKVALMGKATAEGDTPAAAAALSDALANPTTLLIGSHGLIYNATTGWLRLQDANSWFGGDNDGRGPNNGLPVYNRANLFNGASWDRQRGNQAVTLLASAARTADTNSADQTLHNGRGVRVTMDVTAIDATPSVIVNIQVKDPVSGNYTTILSSSAIVGVGTMTLVVYPGCVAVANAVANLPLGRIWRVNCDHADADSITYSVAADVLV